jgi:uncharacterized protein YndB with AHSA1/START domain
MNTASNIEDRTLTISRTLNAPRKLVWEVWTQAEHIAHWWGPQGMKVNVVRHDFRVGGEWEYTMKMPNGMDFISEGKYSKIEVLELIETSAEFKPMTEGVTLVLIFTDSAENTELTLKVIHPTVEYCKQQEDMGFMNGWGSTFDRLASYLVDK